MDIDGAKALNERLARKRGAVPQAARADVADDAPPVYRWFGIVKNAVGETSVSSEAGPAEPGSPNLDPGPFGPPPAAE